MDLARFEAIVAAYGGEPRRWPAEERAAAESFAGSHAAQVSALLADARALDGALGAVQETHVSDLLTARVLKRAPKRARQPFERGNALRPALALAACAVFGLVLGVSGGALAPASTAADEAEAMIASAFTDPALDFETLGVDG